jgi:excisionase family DNA binding protein
MSVVESAVVLQESDIFGELIDRPELVDHVSRFMLPALINHAAAIATRAAALQSRIAARLLTLSEEHPSEDADRLVTVEQAANILHYRPNYIYRLVREDRLRVKREGRKIRIRWGDLKAYIRDVPERVDAGLDSLPSRRSRSETDNVALQILDHFPDRIRGPRKHCPRPGDELQSGKSPE